MRLRPAVAADCEALSALALASKAHWGYDDAFVEACREALTIRPDDLAGNIVEVAELDGRIVGFFELHAGYGCGVVEKMFVAPDVVGRGVGRRLWTAMMGAVKSAGVPLLEVDSDPYAEGFYKAMGMHRHGVVPSTVFAGRDLPFLRRYLPGQLIGTARHTDLRVDGRWTYPEANAAEIATDWADSVRANPTLYDGRMLMTVEWSLLHERFAASLSECAYSAFLSWRDRGCRDRAVVNVFSSAVVVSADGAVILGRSADHTSNAGLVYPFGGSLEPADVDRTGQVDARSSAVRELAEESGLDAADATCDDPLIVRDGPRLSIAYVFRFPQTADRLRAMVESEISRQSRPEIADVVVVRRKSDIDAGRMPGYTQTLIEHLLD